MSVAVGDTIGICFSLCQVSPLALEPSSQWDEGTRAVSGGNGTNVPFARNPPSVTRM